MSILTPILLKNHKQWNRTKQKHSIWSYTQEDIKIKNVYFIFSEINQKNEEKKCCLWNYEMVEHPWKRLAVSRKVTYRISVGNWKKNDGVELGMSSGENRNWRHGGMSATSMRAQLQETQAASCLPHPAPTHWASGANESTGHPSA